MFHFIFRGKSLKKRIAVKYIKISIQNTIISFEQGYSKGCNSILLTPEKFLAGWDL